MSWEEGTTGSETSTEIPRAESGDVVELILEDQELHHLDEEERDILNAPRDEVFSYERAVLGSAWVQERNRMLEGACGSITHVRAHLDLC